MVVTDDNFSAEEKIKRLIEEEELAGEKLEEKKAELKKLGPEVDSSSRSRASLVPEITFITVEYTASLPTLKKDAADLRHPLPLCRYMRHNVKFDFNNSTLLRSR